MRLLAHLKGLVISFTALFALDNGGVERRHENGGSHKRRFRGAVYARQTMACSLLCAA